MTPTTSSSSSSEPEATFTRRKFTITETLDQQLVELANDHYQGNVSLCLRAAIEDHKQTLYGEGEIATRRLATQMDDLVEQQRTIRQLIDTLETGATSTSSRSETAQTTIHPSDMTDDMYQVLDAIPATEDGTRIDDVVEQLDMPVGHVQTIIGRLVDRGYVFQTADQTERYRLPGSVVPEEGRF